MSYVSAENVLPKELIETIQQYVSGQSIYIPCKEEKSGEARLKQSSIMKWKTLFHEAGVPTSIKLPSKS